MAEEWVPGEVRAAREMARVRRAQWVRALRRLGLEESRSGSLGRTQVQHAARIEARLQKKMLEAENWAEVAEAALKTAREMAEREASETETEAAASA